MGQVYQQWSTKNNQWTALEQGVGAGTAFEVPWTWNPFVMGHVSLLVTMTWLFWALVEQF